MPYQDRFQLADDYIAHVDAALSGITDPFIKSRYIGFVAVTAVTVYELAIKDIFFDFSEKKHKVLGNFVRSYFERLNGQIGKKRLVENYLPRFGEKYAKRFKRKLERLEDQVLRSDGVSVKSSYGNVLTWRNKFAHEGIIPATPTYEEVKKAYQYGRRIIECLADTMVR
jgi:RiboL-PSP-HEPN